MAFLLENLYFLHHHLYYQKERLFTMNINIKKTKSLLNYVPFRAFVPYVPSGLTRLRAFVPYAPWYLHVLRAFVPSCLRALRAFAPYAPLCLTHLNLYAL